MDAGDRLCRGERQVLTRQDRVGGGEWSWGGPRQASRSVPCGHEDTWGLQAAWTGQVPEPRSEMAQMAGAMRASVPRGSTVYRGRAKSEGHCPVGYLLVMVLLPGGQSGSAPACPCVGRRDQAGLSPCAAAGGRVLCP